ncbi:gamma-glutamyltransferase family protein [Microbacterium dauci]|uniref:Gamma-glutamyltransferase n=1 Tax=Microbacterium dauci TaxID=3048008 RepID=A0ABT6ZBG2_9MICO|nr:gamma-glutamyltransferase [Microbacterium sp. LX3-4]MDJ1113494.1 gamma-glutamyltransferase [Microbacterium sp. LX3-4]
MTFTPQPSFTTRPQLSGAFGMAASTHATATAVAQSVLERGGNAFDAACAGGFALHLAEPHLNGPGGDLVGLFQPADAAEPTVLMGQGPAPAGATISHFRAEGLDLVPGTGGLAAAVPGAVDAWFVLLRDHGTWELADVLAYAIDLARSGHPLLPTAAATIGRVAVQFREHWPSSAELWLDAEGAPPAAGTRHRNPTYARTLERLVKAGDGAADRVGRIEAARAAWRTGFVADAASAFLGAPHRHADGGDHAAVITPADFAGFEAGYEQPLSVSFRGATVFKAGAWTQGPALLEALRILEPLDTLDPATPEGAHTILETLKLVLADRDAHFGDGADVAWLLADPQVAARRALLGGVASADWRATERDDTWVPPLRRPDASGPAAGTGEPTVAKTGQTRGDTCQIDVVDRWGNIVAVTPSGGWLQSSPTIPELGFCLGTRLQVAWLDESSPSALRPGRRPRTTLSPTMVHQGDTVIAMGTPGGDQQDQWQLPMLLRMLVGGYTAQQAIDAPTLHTTAMVDSFWPRTWTPAGAVVEDRLGDEVIDALVARGHAVTRAGDWALGRLGAVGLDRATGELWAAANPRGMQGYAAGR